MGRKGRKRLYLAATLQYRYQDLVKVRVGLR